MASTDEYQQQEPVKRAYQTTRKISESKVAKWRTKLLRFGKTQKNIAESISRTENLISVAFKKCFATEETEMLIDNYIKDLK